MQIRVSLPHRPRLSQTWNGNFLQVLHLIRHGESEYNAATNGPGWEDPEIFDAPLTARGKQQVSAGAKLPQGRCAWMTPFTPAL